MVKRRIQMAKRKRIKRPKGELKQELKDQIKLLQHSCTAFDSGLEAIGKHIALSLRVLLHEHGQSRSLLEQLGLRTFRYFDTAGPLNPNNVLSECNFIVQRMSSEGGQYIPACQAEGLIKKPRRRKFLDWWNNPVFKDRNGRKFCRRDLILHVADTDGGAHVDPELDESYMAISRENSLGFLFGSGDLIEVFKGRPELACMRQIAHEILLTLSEKAPEYIE